MRIAQKRPYLAILIILTLIPLFAACDPAAPNLIAEQESALPVGNPELEDSENNNEPGIPRPTPTSPPPPQVTPNEARAETDSGGIPVGFTDDGHAYKGNPHAAIVIEEYSDYQCPFCSRWVEETLPSLIENQIKNGEVLIIYYDFPLNSIHPQAAPAANAARCAGEQGAAAYWQMHDLLFANFGEWGHNNANDNFIAYGAEIGLEMDDFTACVEAFRYEDAIQADVDGGLARGVNSTPSFFINNQPLIGAQPLDVFNQAIAIIAGGGELASAPPQEAQLGPPPELVIPQPADVPIDSPTTAFTMGDPNAPVTLVEFTDYQCPFCLRHVEETMPSVISQGIETGRIFYVLKDFPLDSIHPEAFEAAVAARCAGEQDLYLEMHDALFISQSIWGGTGDEAALAYFATLAKDVGLDTAVYEACMASGSQEEFVRASQAEGQELGVTGTPNFFFNGYFIRGGFRFEDLEPIIQLAEDGELEAFIEDTARANYEAQLAQYEQAKQQLNAPPEPSEPIDVPIENAYAIGDPNAPVTIVEYTDYQCPFCSRHFAQTYPLIKENYIDTGIVRYVFKDFPLTTIHPQAVLAAEAARCAGAQDAYVPMHDVIFAAQSEWSGNPDAESLFTQFAGSLGLDTKAFAACLEDHTYETAVLADLNEGIGFGIRGTPSFFINGNFLSGAHPYETFVQAIEDLANRME